MSVQREFFNYKKFDNIVLLQPTSPLRKYNDIDNAIKKFINNKADSLFSCVDIHPYIWRYKNSNMIPLNYRLFKRQNRQNMPQALIENGSIYVTKKKIYKINKNRLGGKIGYIEFDEKYSHEIDTELDFEFLEILAKNESD